MVATHDANATDGNGWATVNVTTTGAGPADNAMQADLGWHLDDPRHPASAVQGHARWQVGEGALNLHMGAPREIACRLGCNESGQAARGTRVAAKGQVGVGDAPPEGSAREAPSTRAAVEVAVASGLPLLLLALLGRSGWVALFSRLRRSEVLDHPRRRAIHDALAREPGLTAAQVARRVGLPRSTTLHHLAMLQRQGFVAATKRDGAVVHHVRGQKVDEEEVATRAFLDLPARRALLAALQAAPDGLTQREASERAAVPRRLAAYHLALMSARGVVARAPGRPVRFVARRGAGEAATRI